MAATVREQALAAFLAVLEGIQGVYNLKVERNRDTEVTEFPTVVQMDGPQRAEHVFTGCVLYTVTVSVEAYVQEGPAGRPRDELIDEIYGKVVSAIAAAPTLGGKATDVTEQELSTLPDRAAGHPPGGALLAAFEVRYETVEGDPYTQA